MLKFSVCIDALLREYEFCDRIKRAKELGFSAVEFWFWKGKDMELIESTSLSDADKKKIFGENARKLLKI